MVVGARIATKEKLPNYIGGEWHTESVDSYLPVYNPALDEVIAEVPLSSKAEVDRAVQVAKKAYATWSNTPAVDRVQYLFKLKQLLEDHKEEIARILTQEHGKTLEEARGEMRRTIENVEVATGIPSLMQGRLLQDVSRGIDQEEIRQPMGVFAMLAPFNFPAMVPWWFAPHALATGNTYIIKPSEQTPCSQQAIFELIEKAGFPKGVINLVHGARETAEALIEHPDIEGISFVGSTPVARAIYKKAAEYGKRVQAQGGAKNFLVVMPDASMKFTVDSIVSSAYGCAGQRCLAGSAVLSIGEKHRALTDQLIDATSRLKVGYGLSEGVDMGPVISRKQQARVLDYIQIGSDEGAKPILDGRAKKVKEYKGYFVHPTIFDEVEPEMRIAREEIFGPVLSVTHARDLEEALAIVEKNPYGNAISLYTQSGKWAREFKLRVRCGNVGINVGVAAAMAFFPFAGMKDSFFGDLHGQGMDAIRFFTDAKVVISRWV
ncbi:CoA-acylating methylmalonate-semialdehyde dehydrogenase [Candidatus Acetothermia bacterium]|nr:CoA-acylating methylmalonate-semialdehyde dehydrogenase [Candidatus Acetothermia bacterium]